MKWPWSKQKPANAPLKGIRIIVNGTTITLDHPPPTANAQQWLDYATVVSFWILSADSMWMERIARAYLTKWAEGVKG